MGFDKGQTPEFALTLITSRFDKGQTPEFALTLITSTIHAHILRLSNDPLNRKSRLSDEIWLFYRVKFKPAKRPRLRLPFRMRVSFILSY